MAVDDILNRGEKLDIHLTLGSHSLALLDRLADKYRCAPYRARKVTLPGRWASSVCIPLASRHCREGVTCPLLASPVVMVRVAVVTVRGVAG